MPKLKTHKGTAKRFKLTKTGKVKRSQGFRNHIMTHKSSKLKRGYRKSAYVSKADAAEIKRLLPYG